MLISTKKKKKGKMLFEELSSHLKINFLNLR